MYRRATAGRALLDFGSLSVPAGSIVDLERGIQRSFDPRAIRPMPALHPATGSGFQAQLRLLLVSHEARLYWLNATLSSLFFCRERRHEQDIADLELHVGARRGKKFL